MRNHTTPEGKLLGTKMAQWADDAEPAARLRVPEMQPRCASCAFRDGPHLASGSPYTQMDALKCLVEGIEFQCHDHHRKDTPCSGWAMIMLAHPNREGAKVPWDFTSVEREMSETWFTEDQVKKVAVDLQEMNRTMADACDAPVAPEWGKLSEESQKYWLDKARASLAAKTPLDITKPLKMRDGTPVTHARLAEDGLSIVAMVPTWNNVGASWPIDGLTDHEPHAGDLVYADA